MAKVKIEAWRREIRAQRFHTCEFCEEPIVPGQTYVLIAVRSEETCGEVWKSRQHLACETIWDEAGNRFGFDVLDVLNRKVMDQVCEKLKTG